MVVLYIKGLNLIKCVKHYIKIIIFSKLHFNKVFRFYLETFYLNKLINQLFYANYKGIKRLIREKVMLIFKLNQLKEIQKLKIRVKLTFNRKKI
jgi:hypothetical protein